MQATSESCLKFLTFHSLFAQFWPTCTGVFLDQLHIAALDAFFSDILSRSDASSFA